MNGSKDELKEIFDSAFAAESIPFSEDAWAGMNAMLNQKKKKGFVWWWISGITTTGIAIIFLLPYFINVDETYHPRLGNSSFNDVTFISSTNSRLPESRVAQQSGNKRAKLEAVDTTAPNTNQSTTNNQSNNTKTRKAVGSKDLASNNTQSYENNSSKIVPTPPVDNTTLPTSTGINTQPTIASVTAIDDRINLSLMPIIEHGLESDYKLQDSRNTLNTPYFKEDVWDKYLLFGLSKSIDLNNGFYNGFGQRIGAGVSYKLKDHVYLNAEVSIARDAVSILNETTFTYYGLSKQTYTVQSGTYEMLNINLPLLAHYQWNRWKVGGGLFFDYLSSMKIEETSTKNTTQETVTLQEGYYRWNEYKTFNTGLAMDVQYQFSKLFVVGARSSFGIVDLTKSDPSVRKNRTEFYLKYLINK